MILSYFTVTDITLLHEGLKGVNICIVGKASYLSRTVLSEGNTRLIRRVDFPVCSAAAMLFHDPCSCDNIIAYKIAFVKQERAEYFCGICASFFRRIGVGGPEEMVGGLA